LDPSGEKDVDDQSNPRILVCAESGMHGDEIIAYQMLRG
jgi:hypothetical protein